MGLSLSQIINKFLPVQLLGSNTYKSFQLNIGTTPLTTNLPFTANSFQFTNDGSDFVTVWLQGKQPTSITAYNDSHITLSSTGWTTGVNYGSTGTFNNNSTSGANAVYNPAISVNAIGFNLLGGGSAGVVNFQLSQDGVTWVNPSFITGTVRNDGVTGTAMDSINMNSTPLISKLVIFGLPTNGTWQIKASLGTGTLYTGGGVTGGVDGIVVKVGEVKSYPISSTSVSIQANSGTQSIRMDVIS